jgi:aminoglycoside phosphotransferase (APT) family kinase protein
MMPRMPERWLDGSTRPPDMEEAALAALVTRVVGSGFTIERAPGGLSTQVYRLTRGDEIVYVRIAEEEGGSMGAEAAVHEHLRAVGVSVPEVIVVDDGPEIGRGVMVVREIEGLPLAASAAEEPAAILRAAGRDLARINAVAVDGFGWIRKEAALWPVRGEHDTYRSFVQDAARSVPAVADLVLEPRERDTVAALFAEALAEEPASRLAHGDFDATHIYHRAGRYTGVIDLGEMRGTEGWYDLAYFHVQDLGSVLSAELWSGYAEVATLPADLAVRVHRSAVMIAATQLARWLDRDGPGAMDRPAGTWWVGRLRELLAEADVDREG